jgi:hypothetical protein
MSPKFSPDATLSKSGNHVPWKASRQTTGTVHKSAVLFRSNARRARAAWGTLTKYALETLRKFSETHSLDVAAGEIQFLDNRWYVTNAGLLQIARRNRCSGIRTIVEKELSDPTVGRWVFKATVYKSPRSRGFVGYGDADPSNVSSLVHGAEMRVAETRAVNRALRKAYGIGLCSVEELSWAPKRSNPDLSCQNGSAPPASGTNGHHNGQPRLRDRLCLLIRQHNLDATLVKAYAADYCGKPTLREASRESIEAFINDLAERASKDRDCLLCHLNSYAKPSEVSQ